MRIDKYLKISRIIKRRTVAKEACDQGRITINDRVVKAGADVAVGDVISVTFGNRRLVIEVAQIKEHVRKEETTELYKVLKDEKIAQEM